MKIIIIVLFILPHLALAQTGSQGIQFQQELTWQQVKEQARNENKFIFVDCYATWCVTCKYMDKDVYPRANVGNFMNEKFVSVKVQMDTSVKDNELVKKWYADAGKLQQENNVLGFPTFLFFSPTGEIVHRFTGGVDDVNLLKLATHSMDTAKQYYTQLAKYRSGTRNYARMKFLAEQTKNSGDNELARRIARDYIEGFFQVQDASALLTKSELDFIAVNQSLLKSSDSVFKFIYINADTINSITGYKTFAQSIVNGVIEKEEINTRVWPQNKRVAIAPDWDKLRQSIAAKYNQSYANDLVLLAKMRWYSELEDWPNIIKHNIEWVESKEFDTSVLGKIGLNNMIFEIIFKHGTKKHDLNKGIAWIEKISETMPNNPVLIDTYANLLYKVGRKKEALQWATKALELENKDAVAQQRTADPIFQQRIDWMRKGMPTWNMKE